MEVPACVDPVVPFPPQEQSSPLSPTQTLSGLLPEPVLPSDYSPISNQRSLLSLGKAFPFRVNVTLSRVLDLAGPWATHL